MYRKKKGGIIMEEIYTTKEVAEKLKVKETTIRSRIKRGDIIATKTMFGYRISKDELIRLTKGE